MGTVGCVHRLSFLLAEVRLGTGMEEKEGGRRRKLKNEQAGENAVYLSRPGEKR